MKINYVTVATENLGSYRYQLLTPATELMKRGHGCVFSQEPLPDFDVYVFHKHFRKAEQEMIRKVKGLKVFVISDYHLHGKWREHYVDMSCAADIVVSATNKLTELLFKNADIKAVTIYDPWGIEFEEQKPSFSPKDKLVLLWFGHSSNISGLQENLKNFDGCRIMIVTDGNSNKIIPYSIENLKLAFKSCDVVVIPQNLEDPGKQTKTHNRIVDSFRAGKFVLASPVDSYLDFKDCAFIGGMKEGINWIREQPREEIERRIGEAQKFINKTFDPRIIADQWENTFTEGLRNGALSLSKH